MSNTTTIIPLDFFAKSHKRAQVLTHMLLHTQTVHKHRPSPMYMAWSRHAPMGENTRSKQLNIWGRIKICPK